MKTNVFNTKGDKINTSQNFLTIVLSINHNIEIKKKKKKKKKEILKNHEVYNFERSSEKAFLITSLLILKAPVTRPDSGVHGSESNLIFAGISNLCNRALFASCKQKKYNREN
jgi:hypothetical protein